MEEEKVKQRWKEYFDDLLNQPNPKREKRNENRRDKKGRGRYLCRRSQDWIEDDEKEKAHRPDYIPVEAWIALGNKGVEIFFTITVIQSLFLTKFYANFKTKKQTVKPKNNLSIFLSFPTSEKSQKNSVYKFNH